MFRIIKIITKIKQYPTHHRLMCHRPSPHDVAESEEKDLGVWGEVDEKDTEFKGTVPQDRWHGWFHS